MGYSSHKLPLLLERVGVRRIKSTCYIPLILTLSQPSPARESVARVQELVLV